MNADKCKSNGNAESCRNSRRDFFRDTIRCGALLGVALLLAQNVKRRSEECINQGFCKGCSEFAECGLPQALSARAVKKGVHT